MINNGPVDFIVRNDDQLLQYLKNNPSVYVSPALTGGFNIAYIKEAEAGDICKNLCDTLNYSYAEALGLVDVGNQQLVDFTQIYNTTGLGGKGVIFAIVDTGIDYLNNIFMNKDRTSRIISIYDQTVEGNAPYRFGVGSEYDQKTINEAVRSKNPFAVVPSFDDVGHGTFLASVAAGNKQRDFAGVAYESELIVVKLRKAHPFYLRKYLVPAEQENAFSSSDVMLGVEYIVRKAAELGRPAVICLGMGSNFGGHDGYSLFEQYLSAASKINGICICAAAGNECLAKHHFYGYVAANGDHQDALLSVGEDGGDIYLTMWNNAPDILRISVTSPSGSVMESVSWATATMLQKNLLLDKCNVRIEYNYPVYGCGCQNTVIKILCAAAGTWIIRVHGEQITDGYFHIWLPIIGFIAPDVDLLMPYKNYTITIPGTSPSLITCRAYNTFTDSLCVTSSWGPTRTNKMSPDLVCPGVDISGIYPGGSGKMSGTGVAAAILSGSCAILMQKGLLNNNPPLNTAQIRNYLIRGATRPPGIEYPNDQWGYGLLNLNNSLEKM